MTYCTARSAVTGEPCSYPGVWDGRCYFHSKTQQSLITTYRLTTGDYRQIPGTTERTPRELAEKRARRLAEAMALHRLGEFVSAGDLLDNETEGRYGIPAWVLGQAEEKVA